MKSISTPSILCILIIFINSGQSYAKSKFITIPVPRKPITCKTGVNFKLQCMGDYCFYAETPDSPVLRGCLSGDLLRSDIVDQCEMDENGTSRVCVCKEDVCNERPSKMIANTVEQESQKTCYQFVTHPGTNSAQIAQSFCTGTACSLIRYANGTVERGCNDASMPLFEKKNVDACMQPAFPNHLKPPTTVWDESALKTATCFCDDTDRCNGMNVFEYTNRRENLKTCQASATMIAENGIVTSASVECKGEHCYSIQVKLPGKSTLKITGCMTFVDHLNRVLGTGQNRKIDELNSRGCMKFVSETFEIQACFDTNETMQEKASVEVLISDQKVHDRDHYRIMKSDQQVMLRDAPAPADADPIEEKSTTKAPPVRVNRVKLPGRRHAKPPPKEVAETKEPEKIDESPKPDKTPIHPGTHAPQVIRAGKKHEEKQDTEGNTAIVAVFVVIMILIAIAGIVWKFELHKKIFQARYQTVAG